MDLKWLSLKFLPLVKAVLEVKWHETPNRIRRSSFHPIGSVRILSLQHIFRGLEEVISHLGYGQRYEVGGSLDKTPMTKCHCPKPLYKKCSPQPQNTNPQTRKSGAFHTLAFCPWHSDRIPKWMRYGRHSILARWAFAILRLTNNHPACSLLAIEMFWNCLLAII